MEFYRHLHYLRGEEVVALFLQLERPRQYSRARLGSRRVGFTWSRHVYNLVQWLRAENIEMLVCLDIGFEIRHWYCLFILFFSDDSLAGLSLLGRSYIYV